jgi:hypothetical protein
MTMDIDEPLDGLADRLRRTLWPDALPWDAISPSNKSDWRRVAAEARKAVPATRMEPDANAKGFISTSQDDARALRERVILAVYRWDHDRFPADFKRESDWIISYINGQSP